MEFVSLADFIIRSGEHAIIVDKKAPCLIVGL